jgi:hypothetical protein
LWAAFKTSKTAAKLETTNEKVDGLHIIVNSRLTQLLQATGAAKLAEGMIEGAKGGRAASIVETDARAVQAASHSPLPTEMPPVPVMIVANEPVPVVVHSPEQRLEEIRGGQL